MYTYSLFLRHFLFNFFHFSSGYWLVSLPNVIKCRRHLELYLLSIFVKGHGGKLFDKRVRFQKVSQIGGICFFVLCCCHHHTGCFQLFLLIFPIFESRYFVLSVGKAQILCIFCFLLRFLLKSSFLLYMYCVLYQTANPAKETPKWYDAEVVKLL